MKVKEVTSKRVFLIILCLGSLRLILAQNTWIRSEPSPIIEISDVIINQENELFINTKNTHHIFYSSDSSTSWKKISVEYPDKFRAQYNHKYFKLVGRDLYCGWCSGSCKRLIYNNQQFNLLNGLSFPFLQLQFDNDGRGYIVSNGGIYNVNSEWQIIPSDIIIKFSDLSLIKSFLYSKDNNYVVSRPYNSDLVRVLKVNTQSKDSILYATFQADINSKEILVSSEGNIYYLGSKLGKLVLFYSSNVNPFHFVEYVIDTTVEIKAFNFFMNQENQIFALTDKGIYINDRKSNSWIKCHLLSKNFPIKIYNTNGFDLDSYIYIKDSLNAIISYGDNCGQASIYTFTPKYKNWRPVELNLNRDNFSNLVRDKNGMLYTYRPCENLTNHNYLESENDGKDWNSLYINGEPVSSVGINKNGEAIALAYKSIYIHDSNLNNWNLVSSPITKIKEIVLLQFYSNKDELFISGISQSNINPVKNYLFHSSDGGYNWNEITAFVTSSHDPSKDFEIFVDNYKNWIVYSDQLSFIPNTFLISKDLGKSWEVDQRFKDFEFVSTIQQLSDNRYLISGKDKFKKYGSFISNASGGFDLISAYFEGHPSRLYLQSNNNLFGYSSWTNGSPIPFTSNDVGNSVREDDSGILLEDLDYRSIQSAILTPGQRTVLNLAHDGIYNSNTDVFSNSSDHEPKTLNKHHLYQHSSYLQITKFDGSEFKSGEIFNLYSCVGQLINSNDLKKQNGRIEIDYLPNGLFFVEIRGSNNQKELIKFTHFNL
ncbi:MAG: hypothetical protein ABI851_14765 [Saprospiraceae bacterium]